MKKRIYIIATIGILVVLGLEFIARFLLGLGDPPLSIADNEIDYLFAPNQSCCRLGNRIVYNKYSMRSDFDPDVGYVGRRIIVCGDSVVNGGVLTDQKDIATSILNNMDGIQCLNVSAGSWGPGNIREYLYKYGTFNSTDLVLVFNGPDLWEDNPRTGQGAIVGRSVSYPDHKPISAFVELIRRYVVPYLKFAFVKTEALGKFHVVHEEGDESEPEALYNLRMLDDIASLPIERKLMIFHRRRRGFQDADDSIGEKAFKDWCASNGVTFVVLPVEESDYRENDCIHLNEHGQRKLAETIRNNLINNKDRQ